MKTFSTCSRRSFLGRSALAAAPLIFPGSALGLNGAASPGERIAMGCIGIGGMGTLDMVNFLAQADVQILAVCDVDSNHRAEAKRKVDEHYGNSDCAAYNDFGEILGRDDIDAVLIATPDHWHAPLSILAARAGKDVYCEKPISLTVGEGRAVVEAMARYGRVYQSGTQRRSIACFRFAVDVARSGRIGGLHTIHTYLSEGQQCSVQAAEPVPAGFDYDRWLGPCPWMPYTAKRCHGSFRWVYDSSGGQLTDIGAHFNDLAQWGNDSEHTGPIAYEGTAEFPREGLFDTPIHYHVEARYADGVRLIFHDTSPRAVRFEGSEGWVSVDDDGNVGASPESLLRERRFAKEDYAHWEGHHRDFLRCVRTRGTPIARPEIAHRSSTICHIGNICLRLGRGLQWDPELERFVDDAEADRMLFRTMRSPWRV